jgi:hypothetical protein
VRADAATVREKLAALTADDRAKVEMEAQFLLVEADAALAPPPAPLGGAVVAQDPPAAPPVATPASPAPRVQPVDEHGGRTAAVSPSTTVGTVPQGEDHGGSPSSGPGPSGDGSTVTTIRTDNSGPGSGGTDDGSSHHGGGDNSGPG